MYTQGKQVWASETVAEPAGVASDLDVNGERDSDEIGEQGIGERWGVQDVSGGGQVRSLDSKGL